MLKRTGLLAATAVAFVAMILSGRAPSGPVQASIAAPQRTGACCFANGSCQILTQRNCDRAGGTYLGNNTNCGQCPTPTGACCLDNGSCAQLTQSQCLSQGGVYHGNNTTCAQVVCEPVGACCYPTLPTLCGLTTAVECANVGGTYHGDGTVCEIDTCGVPEIPGACCVPGLGGSFCLELTLTQCWIWGGEFHGEGSSCTEVECPIIVFPPPETK